MCFKVVPRPYILVFYRRYKETHHGHWFRRKGLSICITLAWLFAVISPIIILVHNGYTDSVQYTFNLTQSGGSGPQYEVVINSGLLDHNHIHWEIRANKSTSTDPDFKCYGEFDLKDIEDIDKSYDDESEKKGKYNPALNFIGNLGIATVAIGEEAASTRNQLRQLSVGDLKGHQLSHGSSIDATLVTAQCAPAGATHAVADFTYIKNPCPSFFSTPVSSQEGTGAYDATNVDPTCAEKAMDVIAFGTSGATSSALTWAVESSILSLSFVR